MKIETTNTNSQTKVVEQKTAQAALKKMPVRIVSVDSPYRQVSCTALAVAVLGGNGTPTREGMRVCTEETWPHRVTDPDRLGVSAKKDPDVYGVMHNVLKKIYAGWIGLRYTAALVDGCKFPRTCILQLKSKTHGGEHVVCRFHGELVDTFDTRNDEDAFEIVGFYK